jgi:hypothetical protein
MIKTQGTINREKKAADDLMAAFLEKGGVVQVIPPSAWDEESEKPKVAPSVIGVK